MFESIANIGHEMPTMHLAYFLLVSPFVATLSRTGQRVGPQVSESFLYVAGEDAAKQEGLVRQVGVTHIINCAGPQCPNYLEYVSCTCGEFWNADRF